MQEEESSLFSLSLDPATKNQLATVAQWARVFAIVSVLLLSIAMARTIYTTYELSQYEYYGRSNATADFIGSLLGYLLIFFIPAIALIYIFRFAGKLKTALDTEDQSYLNNSFKQLKIYFRYMSIVIIILMIIIGIAWIMQAGRAI